MKKDIFSLFTIFFFFMILMGSIVYLFQLRFSYGDIYPEYSTYRSDPFGCKVLYESLQLTGFNAKRCLDSTSHIEHPENSVLFRNNIKSEYELVSDTQAMNFIYSGGTLIAALSPDIRLGKKRGGKSKIEKIEKKKAEKAEAEKKDVDGLEEGKKKDLHFENLYRAKLEKVDLDSMKNHSNDIIATPNSEVLDLHCKPIVCDSGKFFKIDKKDWTVLYCISDDKPVIIKTSLGRGTLVLAVSSFFLSNEAMKNAPNPYFLASLCLKKNIFFDEHALGISEPKNIVWLIKKYKLHFFLINLLLLLLLFFWHNALAFSNICTNISLPGNNELPIINARIPISAQESLLRSRLSKKDLLDLAFGEWLKIAVFLNISDSKIEKIKKIINSQSVSNFEKYNEINLILSEKEFYKND